MAELSPDDFAPYFETVHGSPPFPWQARLLADVVRTGRFPALLDLPTGTGKTAAIDVALFHLALDASRPAPERAAPRRILMVVDRRTVVDQTFERAAKIKAALAGAQEGVLKVVADRLRSLSNTETPLALAQLRGGMPRDDGWARRPDQPLVAVSTVDQVGSRLLFRGYGVSEAMRPIHAGLLGSDALILLDEVHLSQPFRETLSSLGGYRAWARSGLPDRWQVVEMSATPGSEARPDFGLDAADRRHPLLMQRLRASKPAELGEVKVSGSDAAKRTTFADACAERAVGFATPGRTVCVVVNRVAAARETFVAVRKTLGERAQVFLVTGRMRPLDRDALDRELVPLVRSGRDRDAAALPVVVVSTQCIEAGADFDFDALVTECASLDALRQRFGRLNRLGTIDDARAVVLVRSDALGKEVDPIYGETLPATWRWLGQEARDFGIDALALPEGEALAAMLAPKARAPVMLPAHLDLWVQTKPTPQPDPDVALWLHGIDQRRAPEVQIVWRADLTEDLLAAARSDKAVGEALQSRLDACPPSGLEALSVPLHAARAWLCRRTGAEIADVEGRSTEEAEERRGEKPAAGRPVLWWRADDRSTVLLAEELRPEITVVVPSTYGGIADGAWDPSSLEAVPDLGDQARWQQTRRATLRLCNAAHPELPALPQPAQDEDAETSDREAVITWLKEVRPTEEGWFKEAIDALWKGRKGLVVVRLDAVASADGDALGDAYLAIIARGRAKDATTEDDGASHTGVEVTLREHMIGVAGWAVRFAEGCGLPATVAHDVELAARWHDAGKVDPRFQRMLHGGSAYKTEVAPEPLAKSALVAADHAARRRAFEQSGYPRGARHELSSVALLQAGASLLDGAADRDLVLHLVASHHGWCRPFAPAVPDLEPVELALDTGAGIVRVASNHALARLDAGVAERFWRLVQRYGWFGLAWLEAILRLADHRRSEQEQQAKEAS